MDYKNLAEFKEAIGNPAVISEWMTVTQDAVNMFAEATGDHQWIHVDPERAAKESPFGGPIAHGFMSLSLIPKLMEGMSNISSVKMGVNYGVNKVRFPNPVLVGSNVRLHTGIKSIEDYGPNGVKVVWDCTVEIEGKKKPACVAEMVSLMFE